jgi:DnaJ-class molecular chaperone
VTAQRCPVCDGRGLVLDSFYIGVTTTSDAGAVERCRTCDGRGAVAVESLVAVRSSGPLTFPGFSPDEVEA